QILHSYSVGWQALPQSPCFPGSQYSDRFLFGKAFPHSFAETFLLRAIHLSHLRKLRPSFPCLWMPESSSFRRSFPPPAEKISKICCLPVPAKTCFLLRKHSYADPQADRRPHSLSNQNYFLPNLLQ